MILYNDKTVDNRENNYLLIVLFFFFIYFFLSGTKINKIIFYINYFEHIIYKN